MFLWIKVAADWLVDIMMSIDVPINVPGPWRIPTPHGYSGSFKFDFLKFYIFSMDPCDPFVILEDAQMFRSGEQRSVPCEPGAPRDVLGNQLNDRR